MRIILVGCGKVGVTLISALVAEGHNVVAMDSRQDVIEDLNNQYDVMCQHEYAGPRHVQDPL